MKPSRINQLPIPTTPEEFLFGFDSGQSADNHIVWEDLEEETKTELLAEYNQANPDIYFEAITDSYESDDFTASVLDLLKTIPLMNTSSIEEYSDDHYKVLMNFYNTAFKMFSAYISSDIQEDILNKMDNTFDGFNVDEIDNSEIAKLRKFYQLRRLGAV